MLNEDKRQLSYEQIKEKIKMTLCDKTNYWNKNVSFIGYSYQLDHTDDTSRLDSLKLHLS